MADHYCIKDRATKHTDIKILNAIVDSLPRKEFEIHDRDCRKVNFELPEHDEVDETILKQYLDRARRPDIPKGM